MKDADNPKTFTSTRMVAPGDRKYFFSIAGKEYYAKDGRPVVTLKRFGKDGTTDKSKESARLKDDKKDSKKLEEEAMQFDFTGLDRINVL